MKDLQGFSGKKKYTILQIDAHIDWRKSHMDEPMGLSSTMRRASEMELMLIVFGMLIFSFQDALIKGLSTEASLLQIFVLRGILGILFLSVFLKITKRPISFRSKQPVIAIARALMFPLLHFHMRTLGYP